MNDIEHNKEVARRIPVEIFGQGRYDLVDQLVHDDFSDGDNPAVNKEGIREFAKAMRAGFPDLTYTVDWQVAEGDWLAERITGTGTHTGEYFGIAPTGKKVTWTEIQAGRFKDGKMILHYANIDTYGMYKQLGVLPEGI